MILDTLMTCDVVVMLLLSRLHINGDAVKDTCRAKSINKINSLYVEHQRLDLCFRSLL